MTTDTEVDDVLASFYGTRRAWTMQEKASSRELIQTHGWTPARAGYVADWIEGNPDGRFWRGSLTAKDGITAVLRNVVQIGEKSGADASAPGNRTAWEAYEEHHADPEMAKRIAEGNAAKIAATQQPWIDLIEEAHAKGLRGPAMSRWVFAERERRTGKPGLASAAEKMLGAFLRKQPERAGDAMKAPRAEPRTDVPLHRSETDNAPRETAEEPE